MESSAYPMLFSPIKVGTTEVKNRVFMPPVSTNLADHGYVTDDLVDHYRARAKGGVGLIITEVVTVEPTYTYLPGDMCCYDDTFIPGWEKLAAAVHEYGCKIMPQLFHPAYMAFNIPGTPRLIAPSFVGPSYAREAPRPITVVTTGTCVFSTTSRNTSCACAMLTPPPARNSGRFAFESIFNARFN